MEAFTRLTGLVAPIDRPNVDTDAIIPKQFLKSIKRSGFGPNLFDEWRYLDKGEPDKANAGRPLNPDFILNQARYQGATVLLARANFGCGSSREHAPWAIYDYGFRVVVAPSFADIFYGNSAKNGLLLVTLPAPTIERLFVEIRDVAGYRLTVDLAAQTVAATLSADARSRLDDIAITLQQASTIQAYEAKRRLAAPWLFAQT